MANDTFDAERTTAATFLVEVEKIEIGRFSEISGLEVSIETEDIQEGGQNSFVHKVPGRMSWPNIMLKRGITQNDGLIKWLNEASGEKFAGQGNKLTRKTMAITLVGPAGKRLRAWEFDGAFPIKWSGPNFSATSNDIAMEELEICHHGFRVKDLG
jgi:phage tail-like protein